MMWGKSEILVSTPGYSDGNGILFLDKRKRLWFFWNTIRPEWKQRDFLRWPWALTDIKFVRSLDYGKTWSDRTYIFPDEMGWLFKNKAIRLAKDPHVDRILIPIYDELFMQGMCLVSDDEGDTWTVSEHIDVSQDQPDRSEYVKDPSIEPILPIYGVEQPTLIERDDGSILAYLRTSKLKKIYQSVSKDGGQRWTEAQPTPLPNPGAGTDMVKLKTTGHVVLAYNHSPENRKNLTVALSTDDGATWPIRHTIEEEPAEFSYPAIIEDSRGWIHLTYTYKRECIKHICFTEQYLVEAVRCEQRKIGY